MSFANALAKARLRVRVGELYYHYKDKKKLYYVEKIAIDEADEEITIVYTSCDHQAITWTRPLDSWLEIVDGKPRFSQIE